MSMSLSRRNDTTYLLKKKKECARTANLTQNISRCSIWRRIKKIIYTPTGQCLHQILRYAAGVTNVIVSWCWIGAKDWIWMRWWWDFLLIINGCCCCFCCVTASGGWRARIVSSIESNRSWSRKLNPCEKKPVVFLRVFAGFMNRYVTFSAKNCSIFLTKKQSTSLLLTQKHKKQTNIVTL